MSAAKKQRRTAARAATPVVAAVPERRRWWPWLVAIAVVVAAVFEIYGPALSGPFLLDDQRLPYDAPDPPQMLRAWAWGVRPLLMYSYWLNYQAAGQDPWSYHVVNVILHLLNGALVWLIVRRLLKRIESDRRRLDLFAGFAALLFLVHPLNTESVSYIASRSETLSVFFFYVAFAIFLYAGAEGISWLRAIAVLLVFGAACLTKEHTVVLIALLVLTDLWWSNQGQSSQAVRRNWRLYLPMAVASVLGAAWVWRILGAAGSAGFHVKGLPWYDYFLTECRAIWVYAGMYLVPMGQNIDHEFPITHGVPGVGTLIALAALMGVMAAAWMGRRRFPLACYGVFVFLLLIAPTSSFVPIADPLAERRVYLPFVGLLLITVDLVRRWRVSKNTLMSAMAAVLVMEAALTWQRNRLWGSDLAIWRDSVAKSATKPRPRFQLARILYGRHQCSEAVDEYAKTAKLETPDASLLIDWGLAEDCAGHSGAAIDKIQQALQLQPTAHAWTQLAMVYGKRGDYEQGLAALDSAARLDPNYDMIYFYRGTIFVRQGKYAQAASEYQRGLALNPRNDVIRDALAKVSQNLHQR